MYEIIIAVVQNVLIGFLSNILSINTPSKKSLEYRVSEIEKKLENQFNAYGMIDANSNLYKNQALQLFFKTLENLDIYICVKPKNQDKLFFEIKKDQLEDDQLENVDYVIKSTAQEVLDLETIKPTSDIINTTNVVEDIRAEQNLVPQSNTAKDILRKSRERFQQRLTEGENYD